MGNEIVVPENQPITKATNEVFQGIVKTGDWLPRLQVNGSSTELVKSGKLLIGTLGLIYDQNRFVQLNPQEDIICYDWRAKSLDMRAAQPVSHFDVGKEAFQIVQKLSQVKDSRCLTGPEFLVYIPSQDALALFFMGNKSAKKEAPNLLALMKQAGGGEVAKPCLATVKVKFIPKNGPTGYSWHAPQILECNTPIASQPDVAELAKELEKFANPPENLVEVDESATDGGRER